MSDILKSYTALTPSSPRTDVANILSSVIDAPLFTFDKTVRVDLIRALLADLKNCGSKGKLMSKDAAQALLAVKTLGKDPAGSRYLGSATNLAALLSLSSTFRDDLDASCEALRCIANALLLIDEARTVFIEKEVNGAETCITVLDKTSSPDLIFILSRILFLCTASAPSYLQNVVEEKHHGHSIVEIISVKLDLLTSAILAGTKMSKEAMSDLLKFSFNLLLHYPKMVESEPQNSEAAEDDRKVMGDYWNSKLDGLLPPLLRVFSSLPPTSPNPIAAPLTHVIHSLITIPIAPSLRSVWLNTTPTRETGSIGSSAKSSPSQTPADAEAGISRRSISPTRSSQSTATSALKPSTLDRALSVIAAGCRSLARSPSPNTSAANVLQRACDLLDVSFSHYFPSDSDPDDAELRDRAKKESPDNSLDDLLSPLVVLVTKFCIADEASRMRVRTWLVPDDLDRTVALETRADLLGKCLRLLGSVYHSRLKDSVGEMLFAMSDSNPSTLSALVGYGNVAGFLFHKGILNAPVQSGGEPTASLTTPSGAAINPITGTTIEPKPDLPEMTEEEKEREMEKLFVLFDRLEKTGALPADQNPIRKAIHEGKLGNT